ATWIPAIVQHSAAGSSGSGRSTPRRLCVGAAEYSNTRPLKIPGSPPAGPTGSARPAPAPVDEWALARGGHLAQCCRSDRNPHTAEFASLLGSVAALGMITAGGKLTAP